jgi:hypothetical protein
MTARVQDDREGHPYNKNASALYQLRGVETGISLGMRRVNPFNKKTPKTVYVFGARIHTNPVQACAIPSSIQTVTVGSGVAPDHARFPNEESDVPKQARGLYHRSGIAPCPEGYYLVVKIIPVTGIMTQLGFDDAFDRADFDAFGGVVMSFAFDAGGLVDDVEGAVAFADGFGGAVGDARAAGNTVFGDLHGHG